MKIFITLILEFFKTGLFSIGGGLATIPFLNEMSIKYGWFSLDTLSTMIAVSESTPGPIGINMATYVGYLASGIAGGITTTLSLVTPSVIIICIIAKMLDKFKELKIVQGIFYGIRPAVVAFIISAIYSMFIAVWFNLSAEGFKIFNIANILFFTAGALLYKKYKLNPILVIFSFAIIGIIFQL